MRATLNKYDVGTNFPTLFLFFFTQIDLRSFLGFPVGQIPV